MTVLYVLASLGSAVALFAACWTIIRAITGQVQAVKDNTNAVRELTEGMKEVKETISEHDREIAFLKGQRSRD